MVVIVFSDFGKRIAQTALGIAAKSNKPTTPANRSVNARVADYASLPSWHLNSRWWHSDQRNTLRYFHKLAIMLTPSSQTRKPPSLCPGWNGGRLRNTVIGVAPYSCSTDNNPKGSQQHGRSRWLRMISWTTFSTTQWLARLLIGSVARLMGHYQW